jgi:hypothetical protein
METKIYNWLILKLFCCSLLQPFINIIIYRLNKRYSEGQRIYYNFIKPHQALDGKTPAEKVGIKNNEKKWNYFFKNDIK